MSNLKTWLLTATPLAALGGGGWGLGSALGLGGSDLWVFRSALLVLGGVASATLFWFFRKQRGDAPPKDDGPEQAIDAALADARTRLATARVIGKGAATSLPTVLVLGPGGSAKTTLVVRSGLESEALAGHPVSGDVTVPTPLLNVWYARQALVVEAGGPMLEDDAAWSHLVRRLQPPRLAALRAANARPPRAVVVCLSCEDLAGEAEKALADARTIRARLIDLAKALGVRIPVYVVFTKMDRVPHFADFTRSFTAEEAGEIAGVTLPADLLAPTASYEELQAPRVRDALEHIFRGLATRRGTLLAREVTAEHRGGTYEFPREFRKLAPAATRVLVEMLRPSQLQVSPFLRGMFFTGVQAIIVNEAASVPLRPAPVAAGARGQSATAVFGQGAPAPVSAFTPATSSGRKVPRWVFLGSVLPDAVLGDTPALEVTRGGAGVDRSRRAALAAAVAAIALLGLGVLTSFIGNRRLESRVASSARSAAALPTAALDLPDADALRTLDALGGEIGDLERWERDGPPLRLGFGLYSGSEMLESARRVFFAAFDRQLFSTTRESIVRDLRSLPETPSPTDDYGESYDLLKAHLVTTEHSDKADAVFLTPVLLRQWLAGRELEEERRALASRQFERFAAALPHGHPLAAAADSSGVARARSYLQQFAAEDPIYRSLLAEASRETRSFRFDRDVAGSADVVENSYEVPAAFTREGWRAMHAALGQIDRFYQTESWVLGGLANLPSDRTRLVAGLRQRYVAEYVAHWRAYLAAGRVRPYTATGDADRRLRAASGNQSPVLGMLVYAARHTAVDSALRRAFQAVHYVTPDTLQASWRTETNAPYLQALIGLQAAVAQADKPAAPGQDEAVAQALQSAAQAEVATRTLAQGFVGGDAGIATMVERFLLDPISRTGTRLSTLGPAEINAAGDRFCASLRPMLGMLPFGSSAPGASVQDVSALLRPGSGAFARFQDNTLHRVVERQGSRLVPKRIGNQEIAPEYRRFFEKLTVFGEALFRENSTEPLLRFELTAITSDAAPEVLISIDGQDALSTQNSQGTRRVVWRPSASTESRLEARIGGTKEVLRSFSGRWALFQLFHDVDSWRPVGDPTSGEYRVEWIFPNRGPGGAPLTVAAQITLGADTILSGNYFEGFRCAGRMLR